MSHDDLLNFKSNQIECSLILKRGISFGRGHKRVELLVKNVKLVNVFSEEIHQTDVDISDGIFVGFRGGGYNTKKLV